MHRETPITDIQNAADAVRKHGGLMITRLADGTVNYGTPRGDVIGARAAKDLIRLGRVRPVGADLLGNADGALLYEAVIR